MAIEQYDTSTLKEYRTKASEIASLRERLGDLAQQAKETGQLAPVNKLYEELTLRTKEFDDLRQTLGSRDLFMATYGVTVINDHTVSFTIPKNVARIDILEQAASIVRECQLTAPWFFEGELAKCAEKPSFSTASEQSQRLCIDAYVGGVNFTSQISLQEWLSARGLQQATLHDLAVALAVFLVATDKLIVRFDKRWGSLTSAIGGALNFESDGGCLVRLSPSVNADYALLCGAAYVSPDTAELASNV
jgi:hypothetical protein